MCYFFAFHHIFFPFLDFLDWESHRHEAEKAEMWIRVSQLIKEKEWLDNQAPTQLTMQLCPLWSVDFADRLTFRRGTMPQLQMEMFNRLYKAFTGPDCKPWAAAAHTLRLFLGDSIQTKELFYLPHPYLSPVLSFIFLAVLCFITVRRVLQGLGKWDTGCEGGRKKNKDVCSPQSLAAIRACLSPRERLMAFTLRCAHADRRAFAHTQGF